VAGLVAVTGAFLEDLNGTVSLGRRGTEGGLQSSDGGEEGDEEASHFEAFEQRLFRKY
jgi:hypothetical protein